MSYIGNNITGFLGTGSLTVTTSTVTVEDDSVFSASGNTVLGNESSDTLTINSSSISIPNNLNFDSNTLFIDSTNNRVGIGTNSPDRALKIEQDNAYVWIADAAGGNVAFMGGSGANDGFTRLYNGSHTAKVEIHSNADSYFNGGNIGVGTSSPTGSYTKTLHIHGSSTGASLHITDPTSGATASDGLEIFQYGSDGYIWERENGTLRFATNATERMRIDSSGNVGIGTGSPVTFGATSNGLTINGTTNSHITWQESGSNKAFAYSNGNDFLIGSEQSGGNTIFNAAGSERMRIDSSGNTMVGMTTASASNDGFVAYGAGYVSIADTSFSPLILNRKTTDGTILDLKKDGTTVGKITADSGDLVIGTGVSGLRFFDSGNAVIPRQSDGSNSDGALDLGRNVNRWSNLYLSGGVYVGGTGSANYLDDYEEGTWTPAVSEGSVTVTYANYIKIGNTVHLWFYLNNFTNRASTSPIVVSGLPFSSGADTRGVGSTMHRYVNGGGDSIVPYQSVNATTLTFYANKANANYFNVRHTDLNSSAALFFCYHVYQTNT